MDLEVLVFIVAVLWTMLAYVDIMANIRPVRWRSLERRRIDDAQVLLAEARFGLFKAAFDNREVFDSELFVTLMRAACRGLEPCATADEVMQRVLAMDFINSMMREAEIEEKPAVINAVLSPMVKMFEAMELTLVIDRPLLSLVVSLSERVAVLNKWARVAHAREGRRFYASLLEIQASIEAQVLATQVI